MKTQNETFLCKYYFLVKLLVADQMPNDLCETNEYMTLESRRYWLLTILQ